MGLRERFSRAIKHAWNVFGWIDQNSQALGPINAGMSYTSRPDRPRRGFASDKTIISALYTRIAIDTAAVAIRHVRLDENKMYLNDIDSGLQNCLTVEANLDQGARQFRQDVVMTLFENGVAAIVPVDTTLNPVETGGYDVITMRVGTVVQWYPEHVKVRLYNQAKGIQQDITLPKNVVAIVENPLYMVMNEPGSILQRLLRKLNLLDVVDEQSASGKLDILIQLPYVIKTETKKQEADKRRDEIERQLRDSQYGVGYIDGTEKVTQLNRPAENNLLTQVEYLTNMLYGQLGVTPDVMSGEANETVMLNYYNRTIEPILSAITEAMLRTFLTRTARSQGQSVIYLRDPFKLVPVSMLAEISDKLTRNEIASSNDMRAVIGWRPSDDPKAKMLLNKNIPAAYAELPQPGVAPSRPSLPPKASGVKEPPPIPQGVSQNGIHS